MSPDTLDLLLKLRLAVARFGESDNARWWKTDGVLGPQGRFVYERSYPITAPFAQAHVVFAAARKTCAEVPYPSEAYTLWQLPADQEDAFADRWSFWTRNVGEWSYFFGQLHDPPGGDLHAYLDRLGLEPPAAPEIEAPATETQAQSYLINTDGQSQASSLRHLAAGFAAGARDHLVVPYLRSSL